MKKFFLSAVFIFCGTGLFSFACGGAAYNQIASFTTDNCGWRVNVGLFQWSPGSITTTTLFQHKLTGETCEVVTTTGCGRNRDSFDWFWQ